MKFNVNIYGLSKLIDGNTGENVTHLHVLSFHPTLCVQREARPYCATVNQRAWLTPLILTGTLEEGNFLGHLARNKICILLLSCLFLLSFF
jgi:hypothetical protein